MGTRYSLNLGNGGKKAVFSYAFDDQARWAITLIALPAIRYKRLLNSKGAGSSQDCREDPSPHMSRGRHPRAEVGSSVRCPCTRRTDLFGQQCPSNFLRQRR